METSKVHSLTLSAANPVCLMNSLSFFKALDQGGDLGDVAGCRMAARLNRAEACGRVQNSRLRRRPYETVVALLADDAGLDGLRDGMGSVHASVNRTPGMGVVCFSHDSDPLRSLGLDKQLTELVEQKSLFNP